MRPMMISCASCPSMLQPSVSTQQCCSLDIDKSPSTCFELPHDLHLISLSYAVLRPLLPYLESYMKQQGLKLHFSQAKPNSSAISTPQAGLEVLLHILEVPLLLVLCMPQPLHILSCQGAHATRRLRALMLHSMPKCVLA